MRFEVLGELTQRMCCQTILLRHMTAACAACPLSALQFEMRYDEVDRARAVFERYVEILPTVKAWVR
jgi:hypothetical protein